MNRRKQRISKIGLATKFFIAGLAVVAVMVSHPHTASAATDCSDVFTPLPTSITSAVAANQWAYVRAMNETGVPWEMLAAIHYRETNFSHTNPSNGQGIFQFANGAGGPYPAGPVSDDEFYRQLKFMATQLQTDYVWRGSIPRERRQLQPNETDTTLVKDTLFSYNGRAAVYAQQAATYGYRSDIQPFEGSPYVMNRFDCPRARMGIITQDYGSLDGIDTRYGAFTIFARLRGDAYWQSLWHDYGFGDVVAVVAADNGGPQYVVNDGRKFMIPDVPTKIAWNLQALNVIILPASQVNAIPPGPTLNRAVHSAITGQIYMIDNGVRYPTNDAGIQNWGVTDAPYFPGPLVNYVPDGSSYLTPIVHAPAPDGRVFLMDGGHLKYLPTMASLMVWGGEAPTMVYPSSDLFNALPQDPDTADGFKVQSGGKKYIVNNQYIADLPPALDAAFPGATINVSPFTIRRLTPAGTATPLMYRGGDSAIYLANGGLRYYMPTLQMLYAWAPAHQVSIMSVNAGHMAYFSDAGTLNTFMARNINTGQKYIIDGTRQAIPAALDSQFTTNQPVLDYLGVDIFPDSAPVKPLIQPTNDGAVYLIDGGKRYHITSLQNYVLWGGAAQGQSFVAPYVAAMFADGGSIGNTFSVGGTNYVVGNIATAYSMDARAAANWPTQSAVPLTLATLNRLANGGTLPVNFRISATYTACLMRLQQLFCSDSSPRKTLWNLWGAAVLDGMAVSGMSSQPIPNFVYSNVNSAVGISLLTDSKLLHIDTPIEVFNLGYHGETMIPVDATDVTTYPVASWNGVLVKTQSGQYYTFDQGSKRHLTDAASALWTNNYSIAVPTVSNESLDVFPTNTTDITRSIQVPGDGRVFAVGGLQKHWIYGFNTYAQQYAPLTSVSGLLRDALPDGEHY